MKKAPSNLPTSRVEGRQTSWHLRHGASDFFGSDHSITREFEELLQIQEMRIAGTDFHLHVIRLKVPIVKPRTLLEHLHHAFTGSFALHERSDVAEQGMPLAITVMSAADEAGTVVQANAAWTEELSTTFRPSVRTAVCRNATPGVILKLGVKFAPETDGRLSKTVSQNAAGSPAVHARAFPDSGTVRRKRHVA